MTSQKPTVSVGLPVFNGENFLVEALESLLGQTYTDFELIIADNASSDSTADICQQYASKDARIRYFRHDTNIGAAPNFNFVVDKAVGRYFRWAAHDDICAPQYLAECMSILDQVPGVAIAHTLSVQINEKSEPEGVYKYDKGFLQARPSQRLAAHLETPHICAMVFGVMPIGILRKTPLLEAYVGSDRNLLGELLLYGKIAVSDKKLFLRRDHPGTSVSRFTTNEQGWVTWFDPAMGERPFTPLTTSIEAYEAAIRRSPLSWLEKYRCRKALKAWAAHGKDYQGRDVAPQLAEETAMLEAMQQGAAVEKGSVT